MAIDNDDDEIRKEAHRLWVAEGHPHGKHERHWAEAKEIVALRKSFGTTLKPLAETIDEPVEPGLAVESLGDMPGLEDQGEDPQAPSLDLAAEIADAPPLSVERAGTAKPGAKRAPTRPRKKERA